MLTMAQRSAPHHSFSHTLSLPSWPFLTGMCRSSCRSPASQGVRNSPTSCQSSSYRRALQAFFLRPASAGSNPVSNSTSTSSS